MSEQPTQRTLEDSIGRAVKFLSAAGTNSTILALLRARGFQPSDQAEGWNLIHAAAGYSRTSEPVPENEQTRAISDAIAQLDNWDEPNFRVIESALSRKFTSTRDYLFHDGLAAKQGAEAVLSVKTLLDRIDAIINDTDPGRKEEHQQDLEAIKLLEARGYHGDERKRLRALLQTATTTATVAELPKPPSQEERQRALLELYRWFKDWSTTAHTFIKRRDYLILLGLAERKKPKKTDE